jgi:hypothetical protein
MNITGTLNGEEVSVVSVNANGSDVYIGYMDSNDNLNYTKKVKGMGVDELLIATDAIIN